MPLNKYYLSAFSAFVMWGFFSLVLKPLHDYASLDILFYRVFYATVVLLLINCLFRTKQLRADWLTFSSMLKPQKVRVVVLTVMGGFLLVINWYLFIYAVNHVSLQSASFAYLMCPILTTVLAYFILKERLSRWQWLAVALSLLSCVILSFGSLTDLLFSVVIALSFAFYLISQRRNQVFDRFVVLTVQMVIAALVLLPLFPSLSGPVPQGSFFYIMLTLIVLFFTIIPLYLNLYALKGMDSGTVGILMYINPLINFVLAVFYFGESVQLLQLIAYVLIVVSVIVYNEQVLFRKRSAE